MPLVNPNDSFRDSWAPLAYALSVAVDGGAFTDLSADYFQQFTADLGDGAWTGTLTLFEKGKFAAGVPGGLLESQILKPGTRTKFRFRWGWDTLDYAGANARLFDDAPVYEFRVHQIADAVYHPNGLSVTVDVVGAVVAADQTRVLLYDKTTGPRVWVGTEGETRDAPGTGRTATQVFEEIADHYSWSYVTEPSDGVVTPLRCPGNLTHLEFIAQVLVPKAHSVHDPEGGSRGGEHFVFYFDPVENIAHFHSPSYNTNDASRVRPTARRYTVYKDPSGEVVSFTPEDASAALNGAGGGDATFNGFHNAGGEPYEVRAEAGKGVAGEGVGRIYDGDEESVHAIDNGGRDAAYVRLSARTPVQIDRLARAVHSRLRHAQFKATLVAKGSHRVRLLDTVDVRYYDSTDVNKHYLSGFYRVVAAQHAVGQGAWQTTLRLARQGIKGGAIASTGSASDPDTAPSTD